MREGVGCAGSRCVSLPAVNKTKGCGSFWNIQLLMPKLLAGTNGLLQNGLFSRLTVQSRRKYDSGGIEGTLLNYRACLAVTFYCVV